MKNPTKLDPKYVDDRMPLERSADVFSTSHRNAILQCCVGDGKVR